MASGLSEDMIDRLEDIDKAIQLMEELGLETDEIEDVTEAQHELRKWLSAHHASARATASGVIPNEVYQITAENSTRLVQHIMDENRTTRLEMQKIIEYCINFLDKMPETRQADVYAYYPNAKKDLQTTYEQLMEEECVILVAGETGSGKSTLLNLLLGELATDLLPVAHLSSTSAICELKYCPFKKMIVHSRDPTKAPVTVDIDDNAEDIISKHVHQKGDRTDSFEYSKVEVYWPCEWLKGGITIVDSPGVGEDVELTELVKEYLPKASGFIYVINTPNAGGIDPDRLQDLIFSHLAKQKGGPVGQFNPRSAVFVCNKWDDVPHKQRDQVKAYVMTQLQKTWPGFTDDQVFFVSAKRAISELKDNMISSDYQNLLEGIERLIPVGLNNRLCTQYALSSRIMDTCQLVLKIFIHDGERAAENVHAKVEQARKRLDELSKRPRALKTEMSKKVKDKVKTALTALSTHLSSQDTIDKLSKWSKRDCQPLSNSTSVESLHEKMNARVIKRIKTEINDWDSKKRIFQGITDDMFAEFSKEFKSMQAERKQIEKGLTEDTDEELLQSLYDMQQDNLGEVDQYSTVEKVVMGFTAPIWVPIGLVIGLFALPIAGILALTRKRKEKKALKSELNNIEKGMADLTQKTLKEMMGSSKLNETLQEKVTELMTHLDNLLKEVPRLIEADFRLLSKMESEVYNQAEELSEIYRPMYDEAFAILSEMNSLYISSFRAYDVDLDDLSDYKFVGDGSFARVYTAMWHSKNHPPMLVAVKALKDPTSPENASEMLLEEENLWRLQTPNVVKFYGTGVSKVDDLTYPLFVMEYCEETLDRIIYEPVYKAPGKAKSGRNTEAVKLAAGYAHQIASGLMAIHQLGFLHRDLKPENILVNKHGVVKICDLGLAKRVKDLTGTMCGTPLYMAPEVEQERKYSEKADMFGYGMVLWELWYGECVIAVYRVDNLREFLKNPFPKDPRPNSVFRDLMNQCWSLEAEKRPSAHDCNRKISKAYLQTKR